MPAPMAQDRLIDARGNEVNRKESPWTAADRWRSVKPRWRVRGSGVSGARQSTCAGPPDGRGRAGKWGPCPWHARGRTRGRLAMGRHDPRWRNAARVGGVGFGTTFAWSLNAGRKASSGRLTSPAPLVFCLENLCVSGACGPGGSFYVCSVARGCRPPGHLGTGPAARLVRCITLWPALSRRPPHLLWKCPSKLRKIKHLHRKRGATHYRGQNQCPATCREPAASASSGPRRDPCPGR